MQKLNDDVLIVYGTRHVFRCFSKVLISRTSQMNQRRYWNTRWFDEQAASDTILSHSRFSPRRFLSGITSSDISSEPQSKTSHIAALPQSEGQCSVTHARRHFTRRNLASRAKCASRSAQAEHLAKKALAKNKCFYLVEHRGFEPLTPTLPVLCAPSCANAPCSAWSERYYCNGWIRICQ